MYLYCLSFGQCSCLRVTDLYNGGGDRVCEFPTDQRLKQSKGRMFEG